MCIIVDTNTLSKVFNVSNKEHHKFRPILNWLRNGKGKLVFGGSTYKKELKNICVYNGLITELQKAGKVPLVDDAAVDSHEDRLKATAYGSSFNDYHIVAIVFATGCKLICTSDNGLIQYVKNKCIFNRCIKRPKIYTGHSSNIKMLCDNNIAPFCRNNINTSI